MKITLLCSDPAHPITPWLERWQQHHSQAHEIHLCRDRTELPGGDLLFLISCHQIINAETRNLYRHTLVLHASNLPQGRGWSPHIWALLEGAEELTLCLLEAEDDVDTGDIWARQRFPVPKHALYDEIHEALFQAELALMDQALEQAQAGPSPQPQTDQVPASYYPKRTPADSEIDPERPLSELFNQIRVADPARYPAYFRLHGHTYTIELKKADSNDNDEHQ